MKTKLTILILVLSIQTAFSQRFNKVYLSDNYEGLMTSVVELDSSYIMSVNVYGSGTKIYFYKIDKTTGDTLKTKKYILPYQYFNGTIPTICKTSDNKVIFFNGGNGVIGILEMNENLDTI